MAGALPRRWPEPFELLPPSELELLVALELAGADDVDDVPPEDDDDPDDVGTAVPLEAAPAGAVCCAFAGGAATTAMTPVRLAARR